MRAEKPRAPLGLAWFQRRHSVDNPRRVRDQARLRALARAHAGEVTLMSAHGPVELDAARDILAA